MKQAKIFLADERGVTETEWFRSYNTFNFGNYYSLHKMPVEKLYVCNDDTLAGGKQFSLSVDETSAILILPVAGAVEFANAKHGSTIINAGQLFSITLQKGDAFTITNPYENELVNFLQLWVTTDEITETPKLLSFNIDAEKNELVTLPNFLPITVAKLDGRSEVVYKPLALNNCIFAFVIQGAFEMEGILLHARDGVAFWNYEQAEMEALSNDAIILLLEMKLD